jgi:AmpD protein
MNLDAKGRVDEALRVDSPNCDARPSGTVISLLVIHCISLPPGEFGGNQVAELFTNTLDTGAHPYYAGLVGLRVSSHFYVRRDGALIQFVPCCQRAWHAGASQWAGQPRCNDFSIGIELEGSEDLPYERVQYRCLAQLVTLLQSAYPISDVVGHSDIAPGRKTDPGPCFDWLLFRSFLR